MKRWLVGNGEMVGRRHFSEDQIEAALRACGGIQSRAACALANAAGISFTRQALNKAIKKVRDCNVHVKISLREP